jgi:hypothetical protein
LEINYGPCYFAWHNTSVSTMYRFMPSIDVSINFGIKHQISLVPCF